MKSLSNTSIFTFILLLIITSLSSCKTPSSSSKFNDSLGPREPAIVDTFIDDWHRAATNANASVFFGSMADNSIYIGTDATERWTKNEFITFAKPYFDKGKAWDFKPYERDLHVTNNGEFVWFSELLTTWMGVCRGSGVLRLTKDGWKIEQYHLSVTVPNDAIRDFISLVDNFNKTKK